MKITTNKIIIGVLGLAVIGTAIYFISKRGKGSDDVSDMGIGEKSLSSTDSTGSTGSTGSDDADDSGTVGGTSLSRKERRRDRKATCEEKYGKGKDYRQCKKRVRKGGVAFDGTYSQAIGSTQFECDDVLTDI
jgi:hypothetical protein